MKIEVPKRVVQAARAIDLDLDHNSPVSEEEMRIVADWVRELVEGPYKSDGKIRPAWEPADAVVEAPKKEKAARPMCANCEEAFRFHMKANRGDRRYCNHGGTMYEPKSAADAD